ncbi:bifunctional Ribosomal protein L47 [Babesia duncani]|uniref:Large ribosomal subunit protein uL29m n=1 Tax=Babesia duncani TaxID=323732 RepID=A0AAD9PP14_9APIC|nr:bifunctional Ribosomal protein L47 [Babesia duncani]
MRIQRLHRQQPFNSFIPKRGIEELWKGSYLDPNTAFSEKEELSKSGYAWPSFLLRRKSFEDLRALYFTCLKEKNLLLGERWAALQQGMKAPKHGRLKKIKLTIKRILTVITRREIHQQCLRAKEILRAQQEKEKLETHMFKLKEYKYDLQHKIKRIGWENTLGRIEAEIEELQQKLAPLRRGILQLHTLHLVTLQFTSPDWRYQGRYSDLPGRITWNRQYIPALVRNRKRPFSFSN